MASLGERFLWNFYIVDRNKTTFEHEEDVPNYSQQMVPIFLFMVILEDFVYFMKKGKLFRLNDGLTSIALGMTMEMTKLLTRGIDLFGYQWLYERRFIDLDWQSPWTWWGAAIGVDFAYYWVHRAAHEISLFWSGHQVHHSSEEYNLFTAVRQPALQHLFSIGFYHPLALLGVPLPTLLVHFYFNLFYQFWIHTEFISNLGPLEWIFNTASHHRVHHGVNKWCLDKNYAGFLIIWDRMFGTFQAERKDEQIVYGLVSTPETFEPIYLQLFYVKQVFAKAFSMATWSDTFKTLFFGPGWNPGTPRLGDEDAIPEKTPIREKYDPHIPLWTQIYLFVHFVLVVFVQQFMVSYYATFSWFTALTFMFFVFFSLFIIGSAYDNKWWAPFLEVLRCILMVVILRRYSLSKYPLANSAITVYFAVSTLIWTLQCLWILGSKKKKIA